MSSHSLLLEQIIQSQVLQLNMLLKLKIILKYIVMMLKKLWKDKVINFMLLLIVQSIVWDNFIEINFCLLIWRLISWYLGQGPVMFLLGIIIWLRGGWKLSEILSLKFNILWDSILLMELILLTLVKLM